jgi:DNA invertase Pin-like site-specific DNA recombinase
MTEARPRTANGRFAHKVSPAEVREIARDIRAGFETPSRAARAYGLHRTTLWRALKRQERENHPTGK